MGTLFLTKEARIYNGAKTVSSINGSGKTVGWAQNAVAVIIKLNDLTYFHIKSSIN